LLLLNTKLEQIGLAIQRKAFLIRYIDQNNEWLQKCTDSGHCIDFRLTAKIRAEDLKYRNGAWLNAGQPVLIVAFGEWESGG
jgi:hypothetical protein